VLRNTTYHTGSGRLPANVYALCSNVEFSEELLAALYVMRPQLIVAEALWMYAYTGPWQDFKGGWQNCILKAQDSCFYYMFKTIFSRHNKIGRALPPNVSPWLRTCAMCIRCNQLKEGVQQRSQQKSFNSNCSLLLIYWIKFKLKHVDEK